MEKNSRRNFLALTAAGLAGSAAGLARPDAAIAMPREVADKHPALALSGTYDVRTFGAKGDGKSIDTPAVNKAIEAAAAAGGGIVRFPAGSFACFSIHLKSNVALYLDPGAVIVAAESGSAGQYDAAEPNQWDKFQDYGHSHWHNSLIWGEGVENVSILGPGKIWGKGLSRGSGRETPKAEDPGVGNKAIALKNCRNVTLRDFSIFHGGHFGILAIAVDNFTIDNLTIDTNRDGIDIDCCRNVRVSNCNVNSPFDDGICLKSCFGLGYARATENVTITNCLVSGFREGSLLDATYDRTPPRENFKPTGRIKFGTESNGGFKNITVSNCVFEFCRGLALETVDGGLLEDVTISNITMREIVNAPIFMRLGSRMRGPEGVPVGAMRRVMISNVVCSSAGTGISSIISGIPGHEIEDVRLSDIYIRHLGGGSKEDAGVEPPEKENTYPEPTMFGPAMPSYGFFIRHARNLQLNNIEIAYDKDDLRPAFVVQDVKGIDVFRVKAQRVSDAATFALKRVTDFSLSQSRPLADTLLESVAEKKL
ncbi:MAG TPA: glycosyl hydrolase family 28-related protein [Candidatus Angelobacter sp.]|nr:glycosyl hydrolase family 28-related protein [Candidatus Angelobacter sp.]